MVVVHDMVSATSGGPPGSIERVADAGHLVIAPNLYSRGGPIRCVTRVVGELRSLSGRAFDDVHTSRNWLIADSRCNGKIGILGFAWVGGSRWSWRRTALTPRRRFTRLFRLIATTKLSTEHVPWYRRSNCSGQ